MLEEAIAMYRKNAWEQYQEEDMRCCEEISRQYRAFLDKGKTERECVCESVRLAKASGFISLQEAQSAGSVKPGDRIYCDWMGKCFVAFVIGKEPLEMGMNIVGAHIDSPRIDIKQNPLFEEENLAYLDTHYYGGIKKYQWVSMPLALHGVIVKKNGETVTLAIGEEESDPVFYITDLLPHLAQEQMAKTAAKVIEGEELNVLIGSIPQKDGDESSVKQKVLKILQESYGVEEEDLVSAELEIVPAGKTREAGFDRSMLVGYGHDDRVCAYPSFKALLDVKELPERTLCAILTDKEEIGSVGATGMGAFYFENIIAELSALGGDGSSLAVRRALKNSRMLSSDVSAAYDPMFAGVYEKKNSAFLGMGVCFNKFTGSRGKGGASDANAEYVAEIRSIMDENQVAYHTSEIGKVDAGGGGTIAYLCARYGMNVLDCGVPVLSMHAPWEIISKADLYEAYKCYCAFLKDAGKRTL